MNNLFDRYYSSIHTASQVMKTFIHKSFCWQLKALYTNLFINMI